MDGVKCTPFFFEFSSTFDWGKMMEKVFHLPIFPGLRVRIRSLAASILPFASTATFEGDFDQSLMAALMGGVLK